MGKKKQRRELAPTNASSNVPFNNPFAALRGQRSTLPVGAAPQPELDAPGKPSNQPSPYAGKLVLRRERAGRGGKTVTLLQGLAMSPQELGELARELGKTLGTAARAEGGDIALSGDQLQRLSTWLRARGASKIVLGN